jgi:hypothetical protein
MRKKLELLVLESPWSDDLQDEKSVRLFMKGWADLNQVGLSYRMYHNSKDLGMWLQRFSLHSEMQVCYIAGHGKGGRLVGHSADINLAQLGKFTQKRSNVTQTRKGILLGACEVGKKLEEFLESCGKRIEWVAGYDRETPWLEGTMSDLLFLEYRLRGRTRADEEGNFIQDQYDNFSKRRTFRSEIIARWVREDYSLAEKCGLRALDR